VELAAPAVAGSGATDLDALIGRLEELLPRYVEGGPRYTSYPTAPAWTEGFGAGAFRETLGRLGEGGLSVYVHVPFCRSLCHFCACNRLITRDEALPARYLDAVEREIAALREAIPRSPQATQLHWGGGTPTHLRPDQVRRLFRAVADAFPLGEGAEISIEVDPRVTRGAHIEALRECGFNRISLGVQDFDARVQQAIHRIQPVEITATVTERARRAGFESVNFDLLYGLPFQTEESFAKTLATLLAIGPDRIALYGYAHVTWVAKQQRGFERHDLPDARARVRLQMLAVRRLLAGGYAHVGLDHFARPEDELARAEREGTLRRNFMGYTTQAGTDLLGLGPSAISQVDGVDGAYAQSRRELDAWEGAVRARGLATFRGHRLTRDDRERGFVIERVMCHRGVRASDYQARFGEELAGRFAGELDRLAAFEEDGLVVREADGSFCATPLGRFLLRNVAMVFDAYLPGQRTRGRPLFSRTV
jgi:oxygen-independent coproporphyrinogen-3 oxidase